MEPKKWTEVYPHGTKEGDEEVDFWYAIARDRSTEWLSVSQIARTSRLPELRVKQLITKYSSFQPPLVIVCPSLPGYFGYWQRVPDSIEEKISITKKDHINRISGKQKLFD